MFTTNDKNRVIKVYGVTEEEYDLYCKAEGNLNTDVGYKAYYDLMKAVESRNGNDEILYDLAADFAWDDRLGNAIAKLRTLENECA